MLEVESKYALADPAALEAKLAALGGRLVADRNDADHYLNAPDRDYAETDEALRLRRIGDENFLTYKGPRHDAVTKTRPELELAIPPGPEQAEAFIKLFAYLGYKPVAVVRKHRRMFELIRDGFTVHCCLDEVAGLGRYVEVEIVAEESRYEAARDVLFSLAATLGLPHSEPRSYLEMLLGRAVVPGGRKPALPA